jgi:hypothetical protein
MFNCRLHVTIILAVAGTAQMAGKAKQLSKMRRLLLLLLLTVMHLLPFTQVLAGYQQCNRPGAPCAVMPVITAHPLIRSSMRAKS